MEKSLKLIITNWQQPWVIPDNNQYPAFKTLSVEWGVTFPIAFSRTLSCLDWGAWQVFFTILAISSWCLQTMRKLCHSLKNFRHYFYSNLNKLNLTCLLCCVPLFVRLKWIPTWFHQEIIFFPITLRKQKKKIKNKSVLLLLEALAE